MVTIISNIILITLFVFILCMIYFILASFIDVLNEIADTMFRVACCDIILFLMSVIVIFTLY